MLSESPCAEQLARWRYRADLRVLPVRLSEAKGRLITRGLGSMLSTGYDMPNAPTALKR
jgi:hypothetical protein